MTDNQFICPACSAAFSTRQELDRHNRQAHASAENAKWTIAQEAVGGMNCPDCGAQFSTIDQLEKHRRHAHQG